MAIKIPGGGANARRRLLCVLLSAIGSSFLVAAESVPIIDDLHIPGAMAFGPDGMLYIAEWGASRVCKYDDMGRRGMVADEIGRPSGLAFDESGNLYIASYDLGLIYSINPKIGGNPTIIAGGFNVPAGILWADDSLYVANRDEGEIIRLVPKGGSWERRLISKGHIQPVAIAKRPDGSFVVSSLSGGVEYLGLDGKISLLCDSLRGTGINILPDGTNAFIMSVINEGTVERISMDGKRQVLAGGFSTPMGLVRRASGELLVATWGEGGVFVIGVE